jgi:hypothetical protein
MHQAYLQFPYIEGNMDMLQIIVIEKDLLLLSSSG